MRCQVCFSYQATHNLTYHSGLALCPACLKDFQEIDKATFGQTPKGQPVNSKLTPAVRPAGDG